MKFDQIRSCTPPLWAQGGHLQTILGRYFPTILTLPESAPWVIPLRDGDQLYSEFFQGKSEKLVYLFHGLGGDLTAPYMVRTAHYFLERGWSVLMVNHRGVGPGFSMAHKTYSAAVYPDLSDVLMFGRENWPEKEELVIGFSISGTALLNLLVRHESFLSPRHAISVNAPLDLKNSIEALKKDWNRIYDLKFVWETRRMIVQRRSAGLSSNPYTPWPLETLEDVDENFTAPEGGFQGANDYYSQASPLPELANIKTPTVMLTSEDDPFVPVEDYRRAQLSPSTSCHIERHGGHMGYLTRAQSPFKARHWMESALYFFGERLVGECREPWEQPKNSD